MLCYGQTGSGKTYTVMGPEAAAINAGGGGGEERGFTKGCLEMAIEGVFRGLEVKRRSVEGEITKVEDVEVGKDEGSDKEEEVDDDQQHREGEEDKDGEEEVKSQITTNTKTTFKHEVSLQFLEVYGEEVRDLLGDTPGMDLKLRDVFAKDNNVSAATLAGGMTNTGDVEVVGSKEMQINNVGEGMELVRRGMRRRVTGGTNMNEHSSRSHALVGVRVRQAEVVEEWTRKVGEGEGEGVKTERRKEVRSRVYFVDLAGSERQKKSGAEGKRLREAVGINKGLLVLGNCIKALGDMGGEEGGGEGRKGTSRSGRRSSRGYSGAAWRGTAGPCLWPASARA